MEQGKASVKYYGCIYNQDLGAILTRSIRQWNVTKLFVYCALSLTVITKNWPVYCNGYYQKKQIVLCKSLGVHIFGELMLLCSRVSIDWFQQLSKDCKSSFYP